MSLAWKSYWEEVAMSEAVSAKRRGNPLLRLLLIIVIVIVVVIAGAFLAYTAFRSSRNVPLSVAIYPDARQVANVTLEQGHSKIRYVSDSSADEVGTFYVREMENNCTVLTNEAAGPDEPSISYRCVKDGSSFFVTQYTIVVVQPGVGEFAGQTLIDIDQVFGQ